MGDGRGGDMGERESWRKERLGLGKSCGGEKSEMGCRGKEIARKVEKEIGEV